MPRTAERCYLVRVGGSTIAFVPHPATSGLWLRCHASVLIVKCPACEARLGEPCRSPSGWRGGDGHWQRRRAAREKKPRFRESAALVFDIGQRLATRRN
jgi:hypothetical protein